MHRSYNILEHAKFINDLYEIKNIFLFFKSFTSKKFDQTVVKMTSSLNEYFHSDGSIPLFNGSNNIYTENIKNSLNKDVYLKSRNYPSNLNGIAYYKDKGRTLFFDVVQPNKDVISSNLNSGTLSFEFSGDGEKIISNCGASESFGKNPEYLRYSAAHSTIILQNTNISEINEKKSYIKFPQSVSFNSNSTEDEVIFESSHNGYLKKFKTIVKRKISINKNKNVINGEDTIISLKNIRDRIIYDIRFHLSDGFSFNFTNNKKNLILKSKFKKMWLFKCDSEIVVEDSILVDKNYTLPTNQIVIKGVLSTNKIEKMVTRENLIDKYALISVFNKNKLNLLCSTLKNFKYKFIATESTCNKIKQLGFECFEVSEITKFNQILGGRVKTLNPKIFGSILYDRRSDIHTKEFKKLNIPRIDLVVINLYPFEKFSNKNDFDKTIEMIDIGGPSLIRASCKNYKYVTTICNIEQYHPLISNLKKIKVLQI